MKKLFLPLAVLAVLFVGCGGGSSNSSNALGNSSEQAEVVRIITHGSFDISEDVIQTLEDTQNIELEIFQADDTGSLVAQLVLTSGNPVADVAVGIDNIFVQRAVEENVFIEYRSPLLENVPEQFLLNSFVTPVDYGDVCVNYWRAEFSGEGKPPAPENLEDLTNPVYRDKFVTEHPETSSPGLAFMLATIAKFGEDGWLDYWRDLRANGLAVTSGWSEAYYGEFTAGGGERSIVTSYASSPVAEVFFGEPQPETAPTGIITDGCFRQIEYAGVLRGTDNEPAARRVIDWLLSDDVQGDIPLQNFVYPVSVFAELPDVFRSHAPLVNNPVSLPPEVIAQKRNEWTEQWVNTVLR